MKSNRMSEEQALQRLAGLCSQAEHCSYDIKEKMFRWGIEETSQARIMEKLTRERYVDDERFCRLFVKDKLKFNKWGKRKIEQALWAKHIEEKVYRPILDGIEDREYVEILMPMLESKRKGIKATTEYERSMKLIKYAMSRGFTMDIIKKCLETDMYDAED